MLDFATTLSFTPSPLVFFSFFLPLGDFAACPLVGPDGEMLPSLSALNLAWYFWAFVEVLRGTAVRSCVPVVVAAENEAGWVTLLVEALLVLLDGVVKGAEVVDLICLRDGRLEWVLGESLLDSGVLVVRENLTRVDLGALGVVIFGSSSFSYSST